MSSSIRYLGTAYIDNGGPVACELRLDHEVHVERFSGSRPNSKWTYVDRQGHYHACSDDEQALYPTLYTRSEENVCNHQTCGCDDDYDCSGNTVRTWRACQICDEEIEPGQMEAECRVTIPGRTSWTAEVQVPVWGPDRVSLRMVLADGRELFGTATIGDCTMQGTADGTTGHTTLLGESDLGRRKG